MTNFLLLSISYSIVLFILILIILKDRVTKSIKLIIVLISGFFYIFHFNTLQSNMGWPVSQTVPDNFELLSWVIEEPNISQQKKGRIFIWTKQANHEEPRAFKLKYTRNLHEQLNKAGARLEEGYKQLGQGTQDKIIFLNSAKNLPSKLN